MRWTPCAAPLVCALAMSAQALTLHQVAPSSLRAGIDSSYDDDHYCYYEPAVTQRLRLLVWMPGTEGAPFDYRRIVISAAGFGLHAIGLSYINTNGVNRCYTAQDCECFGDARTEMLEGVDLSTNVIVDYANCITSRLTDLLRYLGTNYPSEGWTNYLDTGGSPVWTNIIVGGHSQGGSHAAFIAHQHAVYRCLFFNASDVCNSCLICPYRAANWVTNSPSATPAERYFGFYHLDDELLSHNTQTIMWDALLMVGGFAPETLIDGLSPPYDASHTLLTQLTPELTGSISHHNATAVDYYTPLTNATPVYREAWKFMMVGPTIVPALDAIASPTQVVVTWDSREDILYRVAAATNLGGAWTSRSDQAEGNGGTMSTSFPAVDAEYLKLLLNY